MTRINLGIAPEELCDQHLLAEWHELPRMWSYALRAKPGPIPAKFTLGAGHMRYFLDKGLWLTERLGALRAELKHRGTRTAVALPVWPRGICGHADADSARPLLITRILARLGTMKRKPVWTKRDAPDWTRAEAGLTPDQLEAWLDRVGCRFATKEELLTMR